MDLPETIITLPAIERAQELTAQCLALRCIGAICGPNGVGKTVALRSIEAKFPSMGIAGACAYYRAFHTEGFTRGVRDLLSNLGDRGAQVPTGASLQLVNKVAIREFRAQNLRLLLIDEANSWSPDALRGVVAVFDAANHAGHPLSVIFAGDPTLPRWLGQDGAGLSRTLQIDHFQHLPLDLTMAVLRHWAAIPFQDFTERVAGNDKGARLVAKRIHQGTGGNLRRLSFFARLYLRQFPQGNVSQTEVEFVFSQMLSER